MATAAGVVAAFHTQTNRSRLARARAARSATDNGLSPIPYAWLSWLAGFRASVVMHGRIHGQKAPRPT
jgi:hypothetical protein